jgi:hypothetical protein
MLSTACNFRPLDSRDLHASLGLGMRIVLYNPVSGPTRPLRRKLAPGAHAQNPSTANNYHSPESTLILVNGPAALQSTPDLVVLPDKFFLVSQPAPCRKTYTYIAKRTYGTAKNLSERRKSATERDAVREPLTVFFLVSQPAPYRKTYTYIAKQTYGTAKIIIERGKSATERDAVRERRSVFSPTSRRGCPAFWKPTSKIQNPTSARRRRRAIMTVDPKQHKSSHIRTCIRCLLFK